MLAARTGALYAVPAARRRDDGTQEIVVLEAIAPPRRATRAWVDDTTARATACLERFILAHPTEWLWMHRRWKAPPS
jgi:KDO2-lipid IV(A) lauroyltransferase